LSGRKKKKRVWEEESGKRKVEATPNCVPPTVKIPSARVGR